MGKQSRREGRRTRKKTEARPEWATLEGFARMRIQGWLQDLLEEEVMHLLGRQQSERGGNVDAPAGYRNGYRNPRRVATSLRDRSERRRHAERLRAGFDRGMNRVRSDLGSFAQEERDLRAAVAEKSAPRPPQHRPVRRIRDD